MARQVKCRDTGLLADKDKCFKAVDGKYYSSEAAFNNIQSKQEWRNRTYVLLSEVCGFEDEYLPPIYKKEIKSYEEYGFENVYLGICHVKKNIEWVLKNKDFKSEYARARYISVIVKDGIREVVKRKKKDDQIKKQQEKLIQQDEIPEDITLVYKDKPIPDISSYLEDDD